jgi:uncharacterized protein with HEPN domain
MKDRDVKTLISIEKHITVVFQYMRGISSLDEFSDNSLVQDAVVFNLLQIGELAKSKLSDSFKRTHRDIPWNDIYGFRNRLVMTMNTSFLRLYMKQSLRIYQH